VDAIEGDFNFFLDSNKENAKGRQNFEHRGVILHFLRHRPDEVDFKKWC
jgi:hypothetical protein